MKITRIVDIKTAWPTVVKDIKEIMGKNPVHAGWTIRDVLTELYTKKGASLYWISQDNNYAGFFILRFIREEFTGLPICHIWLMRLEPQSGVQAVRDVWPFIEKEAKKTKCKFIRMWSPREGWERLASKVGAEKWMVIYQKEVT